MSQSILNAKILSQSLNRVLQIFTRECENGKIVLSAVSWHEKCFVNNLHFAAPTLSMLFLVNAFKTFLFTVSQREFSTVSALWFQLFKVKICGTVTSVILINL